MYTFQIQRTKFSTSLSRTNSGAMAKYEKHSKKRIPAKDPKCWDIGGLTHDRIHGGDAKGYNQFTPAWT